MPTRPSTPGSAADPAAAEQPHAPRARHVSLATPARRSSVRPLEPYEASRPSRFEPSDRGGASNESRRLIDLAQRLQ
jgi:hypothetical protein